MTIKIVTPATTPEEYKISQQYNITRYLDQCYKDGKEPSADLMATVDFSEVSSKEVIYNSNDGSRFPVTINETLAKNCVTTLPFEAYEKFITAEWLNFVKDNEGNLTNVAIYHKNLSLLNRLHDLCFAKALEEKEFNINHRNFVHIYNRDFIQPVANVCHALKDNNGKNPIEDEKYAEGYLALVKKIVCENEFFAQMNIIGKQQKPLKYSKNPDWTKLATSRHIYDNYRSNVDKPINDLLGTLASQKGLTTVFQNALIHIMKRAPKEVKKYLGLEPSTSNKDENLDNVLSRAFAGGNLDTANIIIQSFGLTQQDCLTAYENNIQHAINGLNYYSEERMSSLLARHFNENYQLMKKDFFPDLETQYLPLFVLGKDEEFKQNLLKDKNILDCRVSSKEVISLNECLLLAKTVSLASDVLSQEGKTLSFRDDRDASNRKDLYIHISNHIVNNENELMNSIDFKALSDKHWSKLLGRMDDFVYLFKIQQNGRYETVKHDQFETLFKAAKLNGELNIKLETPKKNIMKI